MSSAEKPDLEQAHRQLRQLGLPDAFLTSIMALIEHQIGRKASPSAAGDALPLARIARVLHRASLRRTEILGQKIVDDTSWNMLLDLFVAAEEGRPIYISSLCIASGSAPTTALRHMDRLEAAGLLSRYADEKDRRRTWVRSTPLANRIVQQVITELCEVLGEFDPAPPRGDS